MAERYFDDEAAWRLMPHLAALDEDHRPEDPMEEVRENGEAGITHRAAVAAKVAPMVDCSNLPWTPKARRSVKENACTPTRTTELAAALPPTYRRTWGG